ncbi:MULTISPECIES: DUF378 domain-containing protein [unclassified Yoonia]|uniref:DUF378 domain-containing protein n=1 Tax=unclassified Yoonia TaxID=2629118 RepID=UPI002AFED07A|nr:MULTISPECIES: DUF378 domain-containing protein [unclassified Yoonia]
MRTLNILTFILVIVGGLNWLLVGAFQFDLVAAIFGGQAALLARIVYILVGLSAIWQLTRIGTVTQDHGRTTY